MKIGISCKLAFPGVPGEGRKAVGLRRIVYYTIECNKCKSPVEDYAGELTERNKESIKSIAKSYGFVQMNKDTWICPECAKHLN